MRSLDKFLTLALMMAVCIAVTAAPTLAQCIDEENDPIEDVAGVLDEDAGILYTTEEEEGEVVASLDATQTSEGIAIEKLVFNEETGKQETAVAYYAVVYSPWPGLFLPARPLCQCSSPYAIIYRHRLCRTLLPGYSSGCRWYSGGSYSYVRAPLRRCVAYAPWRYCVERNRVWYTLTYYSDSFCQVTSSVTTRCRFGC